MTQQICYLEVLNTVVSTRVTKKGQICYYRIVFSFQWNPLVLTLICAGFPSPPRCYFCESAKQHPPSNICQPGRLSIFGIFTGRNYSTENNRHRTNDADRSHRKLHFYRNSRRNGSPANKTLFKGEMGSFYMPVLDCPFSKESN